VKLLFACPTFLLSHALLGLAAQAQPPPQKPELVPDAAFRVTARVELVNLEVTVADGSGNFVRDLKRENFRILDEGAEQPITHFAPVEAPAQVLLLVETSPAVYLIHRQHLEAAYALLNGLAPDDRVALATYDRAARVALNFTQDKRALERALVGLRYNLGMAQLNLFDAISAALDWLAPVPGKRAIVLLSTGLDSAGRGWDSLTSKLRSSEVVLYPVALGGDLRDFEGKKKGKAAPDSPQAASLSFAEANRVLEALAQLTGGRAYFPRDGRDFPEIYARIASTLRHQYSLGFPPPARDARVHKIEVQLLDARGRLLAPAGGRAAYRIAARQGYLAPAP